MNNKLKALLLEAPAILLLIICFFISIYLKLSGKYVLPWGVPILFLIILGLYFWGRYFEKKAQHEYY